MSTEPLSSPPLNAGPLPKAALYANHIEIWSSAVALTLEEKGYSNDEVDRREVSLMSGENFNPAYLKINPSGEVPTLVVPLDRYIAADIETKYRPLHDVSKILEFLDKSRTAFSKSHTTSHTPAPTLAPATIDALAKSNVIIKLVHSEALDPEFLYLSARTPEELAHKAKGEQHTYLKNRFATLKAAFSPASTTATQEALPPALGVRAKAALEIKENVYDGYLKVYDAAAAGGEPAPQTDTFLKLGRKAWEVDVKAALELLEKEIQISHIAGGEERGPGANPSTVSNVGATATTTHSSGANAAAPASNDSETKRGAFILGEHVCLADLHLFPWLARVVSLSGGDLTPAGLDKVGSMLGEGAVVGERVKEFWAAMLQRESFSSAQSAPV
ncbi:hypothetical protein FRB94_009690 [Tulasnella sp. JGI-2019a]|nr:hypothetical protein FRB94_009690 [Tulasnella sp. JGI-2019a]